MKLVEHCLLLFTVSYFLVCQHCKVVSETEDIYSKTPILNLSKDDIPSGKDTSEQDAVKELNHWHSEDKINQTDEDDKEHSLNDSSNITEPIGQTNALQTSWIRMPKSGLPYCRFGGHLEYLALKCEHNVFRYMKEKIIDTDESPEVKVLATAAAAAAVGCGKTVLFLAKNLIKDMKSVNACYSAIQEGPIEYDMTPCDAEASRKLIEFVSSDQRLKIIYFSVSAPIFSTLGCPVIANSSVEGLFANLDWYKSNSTGKSIQSFSSGTRKRVLLMNYVYKHKSDVQYVDDIKAVITETSVSMNDMTSNLNTSIFGTVFDTTESNTRNKRSASEIVGDFEKQFSIKKNCSIHFPLGVSIYAVEKSDCLRLCLYEDSCRSAGYTEHPYQQCQLNTEIAGEVGSLFTCHKDDDSYWDYFEKQTEVVYFLISRKQDGNVLSTSSSLSVTHKAFTDSEDDSQYWFWRDNALFSKKYQTKALTIESRSNQKRLVLKPFRNFESQKWSFENNVLQSYFSALTLENVMSPMSHLKHPTWSLQLGRFYFLLTSRHSGKVLDVSMKDKETVMIWSYHGGDNQLWFWDGDCIRSKAVPDKVLDLHMRDFLNTDWGKVYLNHYHGGLNQRWIAEGDHVVSKYKQLNLDVAHESMDDGAKVGGYKHNGNPNQCWTFDASRIYFFILNKASGKAIDASSPTEIKQWQYHAGKNQLWFWDDKVIRNCQYPDRVIDFHIDEFHRHGQGKLYLNAWVNTNSQKWDYKDMHLYSAYQDLGVVIKDNSHENGAYMYAQKYNIQKWSINAAHNFFVITSRQTSKVLDVSMGTKDRVHMWSYHGGDNQLWFWADNSLRSKQFPDKVLDLHMKDFLKNGWGKVYLHPYHGGKNQQWTKKGDYISSGFNDLRLDIKVSSAPNGADVGASHSTENVNQMWSFNFEKRIYFTVKGEESDKVLTVLKNKNIGIYSYDHGEENQLWFWDEMSIRSKKYPDKVVDLHMSDFNKEGWGKIYLRTYSGGNNQNWRVDKEHIVSEFSQLCLDVRGHLKYNGALVGGYACHDKGNQKWIIEAYNPNDCLDKTENDIYDVVQWIPLVSTVWDLYSSIGYAAAGCNIVAEERAIGWGIGLATDVVTMATGGAASGAMHIAKAGVKVGIKFGLRQGLKTTLILTKKSMTQTVFNTLNTAAKVGMRKSVEKAVEKIAKSFLKETIIDPALFIKNVGKISQQLLFHPKMTYKNIAKAFNKKILILKQLKRSRKLRGAKHIRCKRTGLCDQIFKPVTNFFELKTLRKGFLSIVDIDKVDKDTLSTYAQRFLTTNNDIVQTNSLPTSLADKLKNTDSVIEKAELLAVFEFTKNSEVNIWTQKMIGGIEFRDVSSEIFIESGEEMLNEAALIQSFLKKRPLSNPQTVYRFEKAALAEQYVHGEEYTLARFMSTLQDSNRIKDSGIDLSNPEIHPVELTINLRKSGVDISDISKYPDQSEVLIPMGTKFLVQMDSVENMSSYTSYKITLNEI